MKNVQLLAINETLNNRLQPAFIILFGSYSKQTKHIESDLDIAYFSDVTLSHYERFLLAGELAQIVNIDVDLVDLKEVDTVFAAQIYSSGEVLTSIERRGTVYGE